MSETNGLRSPVPPRIEIEDISCSSAAESSLDSSNKLVTKYDPGMEKAVALKHQETNEPTIAMPLLHIYY